MLGVSVIKPLLPWAEVSVLRYWQEQLHYRRLSWIGVFPPWKTEYLESCSTAMRCVVRKMAAVEGRLVWFRDGFTTEMLFLDRWTCIWQPFRLSSLGRLILLMLSVILVFYMGINFLSEKRTSSSNIHKSSNKRITKTKKIVILTK